MVCLALYKHGYILCDHKIPLLTNNLTTLVSCDDILVYIKKKKEEILLTCMSIRSSQMYYPKIQKRPVRLTHIKYSNTEP